MERNIAAAIRLGIPAVPVNGSDEVLDALSDAGFDVAGIHSRQESDYDDAAL
jgi:hypothetical protein